MLWSQRKPQFSFPRNWNCNAKFPDVALRTDPRCFLGKSLCLESQAFPSVPAYQIHSWSARAETLRCLSPNHQRCSPAFPVLHRPLHHSPPPQFLTGKLVLSLLCLPDRWSLRIGGTPLPNSVPLPEPYACECRCLSNESGATCLSADNAKACSSRLQTAFRSLFSIATANTPISHSYKWPSTSSLHHN